MLTRDSLAFRLLGGRISVRLTWLVAVLAATAFTLLSIVPDAADWPHRALWYLRVAVVFGGAVAALLLHEAAHQLMARRYGVRDAPSRLYLFGGISEGFGDPGTPRTELLIALAGPAANLFLAFLLASLWWVLSLASVSAPVIGLLALANAAIGGINLLPGLPLDGGKILRALVWFLHRDYTTGARAAMIYGQIISTFTLAAGVIMLGTRSAWQPAGAWLILLSWALNRAGRDELLRSELVTRGAAVSAGEVVVGLNARVRSDQSLEQVLDVLLSHGHLGPALVTEDGAVRGVLSLDQLRHSPRQQWGERLVRDAMVPIDRVDTISADASVRQLLDRLVSGQDELLAVVRHGEVLGAVDRQLAARQLFKRTKQMPEHV